MIRKNSSLRQTTDLNAFYRALRFGNIAEAYGSVLDDPRRLDRFAIIDMTGTFIRLVSTRTYHSAEVCRCIREELLLLNGMPAEQREILAHIEISEPPPLGTVFPAVTRSGYGVLLYVSSCRNTGISGETCETVRIPEYLMTAFDTFRRYLENRLLFTRLPLPDEMSFHYLTVPQLPHKYRTLSLTIDDFRSAALALAVELIQTAKDSSDDVCETGNIDRCPKIAATGCWNEDQFIPAGRITGKTDTLSRELPDCSILIISGHGSKPKCDGAELLIIRTAKTLMDVFTAIDIDIKERHINNAYIRDLNHRIQGLKNTDYAHFQEINAFHSIEDIPTGLDCFEDLSCRLMYCEIFLKVFLILNNTYHFVDAYRIGRRFDKMIKRNWNDHRNELVELVNKFYPRFHVLLTALYRFGDAKKAMEWIRLDDLDLSLRASTSCIVAESLMLAGDGSGAKNYLDTYERNLKKKDKPRHFIYSARLRLINEDPSVDNAVLENIVTEVISFNRYGDQDKPYRAYVLTRALFLSGQFEKAVETAAAAEKHFSDNLYFPAWPGILWRRHGARAAEALQQFDLAEQWLTRPLPESLADRFILKVHRAASCLLHWAMVLTRHGAAGSPESLCTPLLHDLVAHHFAADVRELVAGWKQNLPCDTLREMAERIVVKSYE